MLAIGAGTSHFDLELRVILLVGAFGGTVDPPIAVFVAIL